ncbi:MAG: methyltransferase [Ignavibacteria bacterium]|nr:methyltransferase [Ignavibacteria bacterium]
MYKIDFAKYPFPARTRHHTNPSFYIALSELEVKPDGYPPLLASINWSDYFINSMPPTKLDIGCGRGLFTLTIADNEPQNNILGIEVRQWCCDWLQNFIHSESIANCGILRYSVPNGLPFISDSSIDEIYYLFPDPWIKTKHIKRRAFTLDFLNEVYRMLNDSGELYLATDLEEVHKYHIHLLNKFGKFQHQVITNDSEWNKPQTNKEIFCRKEGIPFYRIIAKK